MIMPSKPGFASRSLGNQRCKKFQAITHISRRSSPYQRHPNDIYTIPVTNQIVRNKHRRQSSISCNASSSTPNKGLGVLEWTGSLIPQGLLVKIAKTTWSNFWKTLMVELAPQSKTGSFVRSTYSFDNTMTHFQPGRYHLYVGNECPWCHRVLLGLAIRGLANKDGSLDNNAPITFTQLTADPERASRGGWVLERNSPDRIFPNATDLRQIYDSCVPGGYSGRCTAPLLIDSVTKTVVCNESSILLRNIATLSAGTITDGTGTDGDGSTFPGITPIDLYPNSLQSDIDYWNEKIYTDINNGVYQVGFSTTQEAYDEAMFRLWTCIYKVEEILGGGGDNNDTMADKKLSKARNFLCGDRLTEADIRLFPTIVRFDTIYAMLFRCWGRERIEDLPNLSAWMRRMSRIKIPSDNSNANKSMRLQVSDCVDIEAAKRNYFKSLFPLNPSGIVPGVKDGDMWRGREEEGGLDGGGGELGDMFYMME
jgi:putative glutathione S-transferase